MECVLKSSPQAKHQQDAMTLFRNLDRIAQWKNQAALTDLGGQEIYLTTAGSEESDLQRSEP